jgi:hypothetical protein
MTRSVGMNRDDPGLVELVAVLVLIHGSEDNVLPALITSCHMSHLLSKAFIGDRSK